jgi:hypothetical protein
LKNEWINVIVIFEREAFVNKKFIQQGIIFFLVSTLLLQPAETMTAKASGLDISNYAINVPTPKHPSGMIFDRTPTYTWTKVTNASAYRFQLWRGKTKIYTKTTDSACGATICARTPTKVLGYKYYKWRVRAKVSGVWRPWSDFKKFNIHNPNVPILVSPKGTIFDNTPTYKWERVKYASAYRYQLKLGKTIIYTNTSDAACASICARTPLKILDYNKYKWRARAYIGGVWRPWSAWTKFALNNPDVPKPLIPAGPTYDETPTFKWTRANSVKNYQIQLNQGTAEIYTITYNGTCSGSTCKRTPSMPLAYGPYKWRVRVQKVTGVWKAWSAWKKFKNNVQYSDFNSDHTGWSIYGGDGTWAHESSQYYSSTGVPDAWSNIGYDTRTYDTITYEVRMKRTGGDESNPNRIIIRGTPQPLGTGSPSDDVNDWASGYAFQYANTGNFSVYRLNGTLADVPLIENTAHASILPDDWNTLKVVASGDTFKFYINGSLVWYDTDSEYTSGNVGIGLFRTGVTDSTLQVDWAKFSNYAASETLMDEYVIPGVEIPGGSSTNLPGLPE